MAILHDAGKRAHSKELTNGGKVHLEAGFKLLMESGVDERIARSCIVHLPREMERDGVPH